MDRYPNIPQERGLVAMRKVLHVREDKTISKDSYVKLVDCV